MFISLPTVLTQFECSCPLQETLEIQVDYMTIRKKRASWWSVDNRTLMK